jgi:anti-sigma regulatory factor (Ser/Thr protein kinase)
MSGGTGAVSTSCGRACDVTEFDSSAGTACQHWPLRTHLELGALPTAVPCARLHVRHVVREWGLAGIAEQAELLASELVTNAVRASERLRTPEQPVVGIWLVSDQISVVIHVWDASSGIPVRQQAGPGDEGGRGLLLVEALATEWGCYRKPPGKTVWARVSK